MRDRAETSAFAAIALAGLVFVAYYFLQHYGRASGDVPLPATQHASSVNLAPITVPASFGHNTLSIPSEKVTAPIRAEGVDPNGYLGIPSDVHEVGYYTKGASPDAKIGDLLLAGHVNYVGQGTGALGRIGTLKIGDPVITRGAGAPQGWRVTALTSYPKSHGLPADIFRANGSRVLTMVTCGGVLDRQHGTYLSNIVVTAIRVPTTVR